MPRKTFPPSRRIMDNYDFNLPTVLCNIGYHLERVGRGEFRLVDHKGNIVKEWHSMPSLTEMFDLAKTLPFS